MDEKVFQRQVTKLGLTGSVMSRGSSDQGQGQGQSAAAAAAAAAEMGAGGAKGDSFTFEELKAVFTLHKQVACQTHDLLGCRCHLGEEQAGPVPELGPSSDWPEGEDDDEPRCGTFAPASQIPDVPVKDVSGRPPWHALHSRYPQSPTANPASPLPFLRQPVEAARKLSVLQDWVHHDCCAEASVDLIEDKLLRDVIYWQVAHPCENAGAGFKTERFRQWEEDGADGAEGKGMMELKGGMVGFAFARRSAGEDGEGAA